MKRFPKGKLVRGETLKMTFSFAEMVKKEPRLGLLKARIRRIAAATAPCPHCGRTEDDFFCANEVYLDVIWPGIHELVGYFARVEELRNSTAWDIASGYLCGLLPDCRNCKCL